MPVFPHAGEGLVIAHRSGVDDGGFPGTDGVDSGYVPGSEILPGHTSIAIRHRTGRALGWGGSREIAGKFPNQQIADMVFDAAVVERSLLRVRDLNPVHRRFHIAT